MDNIQEPLKEDSIDLRELIGKYVSYWPLFLFSVIIGLSVAYWFNKTSIPIYEVKSTVLVKQEKSMLDDRFSGISGMGNSLQLQNEIWVIKSYVLTSRTAKRLKYRTAYFLNTWSSNQELYQNSPIEIKIDSGAVIPVNCSFSIHIKPDSSFHIEAKAPGVCFHDFSKNIDTKTIPEYDVLLNGRISEPLKQKGLDFTVLASQNKNLKDYFNKDLSFIIYDDESIVRMFRNVSVTDIKSSSILTLSMKGSNPQLLCDFLNNLTLVYLEKGVERKNIVAENTVSFIDSQLGDVGDSLHFSEKILQEYRADNNVLDVNYQTQRAYSSLEKLQETRSELILKIKYYDHLLTNMKTDSDGNNLIAPSSLGISDPILNNIITELIGLYGERAEMFINSKKDNPLLSSNEQRIKSVVQSALDNIKNLKSTAEFSLKDIEKQLEDASGKVNKLPETQRKLFGYERKFKLNDALYTYLLTKRSEVQIAKASYLPDNEILDKARVDEAVRISPNINRNNMMAILLGLAIPLIFLFVRDYLNDKVHNIREIETITNTPLLGTVIHNGDTKVHTVCADLPMSLTAESIRSIRTNIQFIAGVKHNNTILITSSGMSEGKSFFSLNLALSYALNNKKTILVNFDLRKPKQHEYLNMDNDKGLSLYLSNNSTLEDSIQSTKHNNLDVILAGVIPPNPLELIASEKTSVLFEELNKRYDYIIVDSPPVGLVADSLLLNKFAGVTIFVVRQNQTPLKVFTHLFNSLRQKNFTNLNVILNDMKQGKGYYGYSYGYGYHYGYGHKKQKGIWGIFSSKA